jgi:class 3 adenylate cyclase
VHQFVRRELYIEKYNNVSILFADIQNFTPLTTTLSAQQLVETLNDLFGKFDDAAKVCLGFGKSSFLKMR